MNQKDIKAASQSIVLRIKLAQNLMQRVKMQTEAILAEIDTLGSTELRQNLLVHTTQQGQILLALMKRLVKESKALVVIIHKPKIDMNTIEIPDQLPEEL